MSVFRAFVIRDARIAWSYRFSLIVQTVSLLFSLVSAKFIARLVDGGDAAASSGFRGDYFSFALLGICLTFFSYPVVKTFAQGVRAAQVTGTLEAMLATSARPVAVVLAAGAYPICIAAAQAVVLAGAGWLLLGAHLHPANLAAILAMLVLVTAGLVGVGLMAAAFVMAFKQNEPFTGAFLAASLMLSGTIYPTAVLPAWMKPLAPLLPMTHANEVLRGLLLSTGARPALAPHVLALAGFALLLPAGMLALSGAVRWARAWGTVGQY